MSAATIQLYPRPTFSTSDVSLRTALSGFPRSHSTFPALEALV